MSFRAIIALLAVTIVGCGGGGGGGGGACGALNTKSASQKIFGGDTCDQAARSPVVAIVPVAQSGGVFFGLGICSGTLVTVDDILTSAHCFTDPLIAADRAGVTIAGFAVLVGGDAGQVLPISRFAVHPAYDGRTGSPFDVGMATLGSVPTPPIGPVPLLLSEATLPGSEIIAFGYGTDESGATGVLKAETFKVADIVGGNLQVFGDGDSSICPGDSGGPAIYITSSGVSAIAGVNSFVQAGSCVSAASQVSGFVDIQSAAIVEFIVSYAPDVPSA